MKQVWKRLRAGGEGGAYISILFGSVMGSILAFLILERVYPSHVVAIGVLVGFFLSQLISIVFLYVDGKKCLERRR